MKTILATAYAINPYKGSEDGMGWNFVCQIARFHKVIAITRENNREHIEKYMSENPQAIYENMQFLYFDLPYWQRFWKKGSRGAMFYYWLWQKGIVGFIKKQKLDFDIVHNLNFHNDWTPSYLWKLKKPFVWGPIGHHPKIPKQYLKPYKSKYKFKNNFTWQIKKYFWKYSFALKKTVKKADFIFCMNSNVAKVLNLENKRYQIMPSVATEDFGFEKNKTHSKFCLISAGRLVPLKGFDLTIQAFAEFLHHVSPEEKENCELVIVGKGAELDFYKNLCKEKNITNYVKFIDWIERKDLMTLYQESSAFLFPSHEGAGMVVAEALSFGLPVICLDNSGGGEFINSDCGFAIPLQGYNNTIKDLSKAIQKLYQSPNLRNEMSQNARQHFENHFHWNRRGETLKECYKKI